MKKTPISQTRPQDLVERAPLRKSAQEVIRGINACRLCNGRIRLIPKK